MLKKGYAAVTYGPVAPWGPFLYLNGMGLNKISKFV